MKLSEFKTQLGKISTLNFVQPNGTFVPTHCHITEVGLTTKHFIDCGGTVRTEKTVSFQIWVDLDIPHPLEPSTLMKIISLAENLFGGDDLEIEVEFQTETIGKYAVGFEGENFLLLAKETDCLAKEQCGIPDTESKLQLSEMKAEEASCCIPEGGCC